MQIVELEQGTPEWLAWRQQGIGGSDAGYLFSDGKLADHTPEVLARIKLGLHVVQENEAMARGKRLEPEARSIYQQVSGVKVRPVCAVHPDYPWLRASLDGLSEDGETVLEVKCPGYWPHWHAVHKNRYPSYYKAQIQHQLLVTGARRVHYFSYRPDDPQIRPVAMVEVEPDHRFMEALFRRERAFVEELQKARDGLANDLTAPPPLPEPRKVRRRVARRK